MAKIKLYFIACMLLSICVASMYGSSVFASTKVSLEIKPGILSLHPSYEKILFNFNEGEKVAYANLGGITITDATGSLLGWHVNVKASPLTEVGKEGEEKNLLPEGLLLLSLEGARIKVGEGSGKPPTWVGGTYKEIDRDIPTTLLLADRGRGMGRYEVSFGTKSLQLKIPLDPLSKNSTYQSVITWSIQQGP